MGTSITAGMAASSVEYAWPNLVLRALEQGGPAERVTMPILREPPGTARNVFSFSAADIPAGIDLGVIELVTNDVSRSEIGAYREKYGEFIGTFRQKNPTATLLCLGAWTIPGGKSTDHEAAARQLCLRSGGYYVQINELFMDPRNRGPANNQSTFGADDFHPNNLGQLRIADAVLETMNGLYPGAPTPTTAAPAAGR
ncbi:SGNH/GDSL hydrolase family protein [Rhodococcus oxybenzonivorans]|uniref:SGNH/GDSL hydrolase family protein n=1 Tax=Rhodococcus oxybenzonivorans TaxID=1990687 RepID=UPI00295359E8|nr:SGNH/GDSL hydrolase family protein [Rhodococcus oxybenzonivorans]MDV7354480.1 SGNH/GDSL hydrolase family protein [Rhodococcus oxybenzonivorans]